MNAELILLIIIVAFIVILVLSCFVFLFESRFKLFSEFLRQKYGSGSLLTTNIDSEFKKSAHNLADALIELSRKKVGALIVLEKKSSLTYYVSLGIGINADINKFLIISIFSNKTTPLHDGAMIIKKNHIISASSYLPSTKKKLPVQYGSRHRAAIKLTEITDGICFIVSETNGQISYSQNGKIFNLENNNSLTSEIFKLLII